MARMYQAIWEKIKKKQRAVLEVHPSNVARVKKAVMKEKYKDVGFKILNEDDMCRLVIEYDAEKRQLVFELKQKYGIDGVVT